MVIANVGERIAELREARVIKQQELAEHAGISPSTLSQIESGRVPNPHVSTIRKIARALAVDPQELTAPKGPALRPDTTEDAALTVLYRGLAKRGGIIVNRSRREGPSAELGQETVDFFREGVALARMHPRDIFGRDSQELANAVDAYEDVAETLSEMIRQDVEATEAERREASMFRRRYRRDAEHARTKAG